MADQPQSSQPEPVSRPPRRSPLGRLLAIAVVIAVTMAIAWALRGPGPKGAGAGRAADGRDVFGDPPVAKGSRDKASLTSDASEQSRRTLRDQMAGVLMAEADRAEGRYDEPGNQTPQQRREFLANLFNLPYDYPRSEAPADVMPKDAEVLVVFQNPEHPETRMVFVRIHADLPEAMGQVQRQYVAEGWQVAEPAAGSKKDSGWMVRFTQPRRERLVYAMPRTSGKETLAAIYDSRY